MDYTAIYNMAKRLISQSGKNAVLYKQSAETYTKTYDPATSSYVWTSASGAVVAEPTPAQYTVKVAQTSFNLFFKANGYVKEQDKMLLCVDTPEPSLTDKIEVDGVMYSIVSYDVIRPGNTTVLYKIHVRV